MWRMIKSAENNLNQQVHVTPWATAGPQDLLLSFQGHMVSKSASYVMAVYIIIIIRILEHERPAEIIMLSVNPFVTGC